MLLTGTPDELDRDGPRAHRRYYGKYLGFVKDANDPERRGRVRVHCPEVMGDTDNPDSWLDWAEATSTASGYDTGLLVVPPDVSTSNRSLPDVRVWVEFRGGDPDKPIYSGGPWFGGGSEFPDHIPPLADASTGGDETTSLPNYITETIKLEVDADTGEITELPPTTEPGPSSVASYPRNYVWKTPAGHVIELDNTPSGERIRVFHRAGTNWEIRPDGTYTRKVEGNDVLYVAKDSTQVVKGSCTEIIEGTTHRQINSTSTEIHMASSTLVHKGELVHICKSGVDARVDGLWALNAGSCNVDAGEVAVVSAGELGLAGESVQMLGVDIGINANEIKAAALTFMELKCPTGVKIVGSTPPIHPIYASGIINPLLTEIGTVLTAATSAFPPPPDPYGIALKALSVAVLGLIGAFVPNTTIHKVSSL